MAINTNKNAELSFEDKKITLPIYQGTLGPEVIAVSTLQKEKKFYWELFKYYGEILKNDLAIYEGNSVENSVKKYKKDKPKINDVKNSFPNNEIILEDSFEEILDTYLNYLMTKKKG